MMSDAEPDAVDLDAYMDAAAAVARITIAPEWRDAVRANLAVTFRLAAMVDAFKLPDEAEPASVFTA
jgi:hypothetical protein